MRRIFIAEENYYHIYNRGVDKRQIFMNDEDRLRFLHNMYELNDGNFAPKWNGNEIEKIRGIKPEKDLERRPLVEILSFCLMPNHFHFILKPVVKKGISKFMHKLAGGYSKYFNLKYKRSGTLFQGPFKAVLVKTDAQMMHLSRYIHILNPGEMVEPKIREGIIHNPAALRDFLQNYKWSSHLDFLGQKNYPSLINKNIISGYFSSPAEYEKFSMSWKRGDGETIRDLDFDVVLLSGAKHPIVGKLSTGEKLKRKIK